MEESSIQNFSIILGILLTVLNSSCAQALQRIIEPKQRIIQEQLSEKELKARTKQLVQQLKSEDYKKRVNAQVEIKEVLHSGQGGTALEQLRQNMSTETDIEAKMRLSSILEPYDHWKITGDVLNRIPDIGNMLQADIEKSISQVLIELRNIELESGKELFKRIVDSLFEQLKSSDEEVRKRAERILSEAGEVMISTLLSVLETHENDYKLCRPVTTVIAAIGKPAYDKLVDIVEDKKRRGRYWAVVALGKLGDKQAAHLLINGLNDRETPVRRNSAWSLGKLKSEEAVDPLLEILKSKNAHDTILYVSAAVALGEIGDKKAVETLIEVVQSDWGFVNEAAIEALGRIGDTRATKHLILMLSHECKDIRKAAVNALGELSDKTAIKPLSNSLKDENEWVREAAVRAISKLAGETCIKLLIESLDDKSRFVQDAAAKALHNITEKNFGSDYHKWKKWYDENNEKLQSDTEKNNTPASSDK